MLLQDRKVKIRNVALSAVFLAISVIISFVEGISGINSFIPLPGVRLGFCNIAVTACLYVVSASGALCVALLRVLFLFLFSGNPVSLVMSLCGGLASLMSLVATKRLYGRVFSFAGVSCISAVCHSFGQILGATLIMHDVSLVFYLPLFVAASSVAGTVSGTVMNVILPRLAQSLKEFSGV